MRTQILRKVMTFGFMILFVSSFTFAQKTDFSGSWKFNADKSQLGENGGRMGMNASKLIITQEENALNVERTGTRRDGQTFSQKEKYTLDGKETENTTNNQFGNMVSKSTAVWSADNKTLTVTTTSVFERDGNRMERKSTNVYKLSDDGKTLTVESTSTSQRGERKQTLVYDKE